MEVRRLVIESAERESEEMVLETLRDAVGRSREDVDVGREAVALSWPS